MNIDNSTADRRTQMIIDRVRSRDRFLDELVREPLLSRPTHIGDDVRFLIARKWNSWYPSYFKVDGGCYALVMGGRFATGADGARVVVVDPGFRFLEILRVEYDIQPEYIDTVIVTHYHPDHMAGLIEYVTLRAKMQRSCDVFLNSTLFRSYSNLGGSFVNIHRMEAGSVKRLAKEDSHTEMTVDFRPVHHAEIGNCHNAIGLIFDITWPDGNTQNTPIRYSIGILGDTDGHPKYLDEYVACFANVDLLVLHLGTFNDEKHGQGDKHLYITGTRQLLERLGIAAGRRTDSRMIVVLSEFGLELGTHKQIMEQLSQYIRIVSWRLPLVFTKIHLSSQRPENEVHLNVFAAMCLSFFEQVLAADRIVGMPELLGVMAMTVDLLMESSVRVKKEISANVAKTASQRLADLGYVKANDLAGVLRGVDRSLLTKLDGFFEELGRRAVLSSKMMGTSGEQSRIGKRVVEVLGSLAEQLLSYTSRQLDDHFFSLLYYPVLGRLERYQRSLGVVSENHRPFWRTGQDYEFSQFLGAVLIACLRLHEMCCGINPDAMTLPPESLEEETAGNSLIAVGDFFRDNAEKWCDILVADVGTKFKLCDHDKRIEVAVTEPNQAAEETWRTPADVEMFYDSTVSRILYRRKPFDTQTGIG